MPKIPKPQTPQAAAKDVAPDNGAIADAMRRRVMDRSRATTNLTGGTAAGSAAAGAGVAGKTLLGQ